MTIKIEIFDGRITRIAGQNSLDSLAIIFGDMVTKKQWSGKNHHAAAVLRSIVQPPKNWPNIYEAGLVDWDAPATRDYVALVAKKIFKIFWQFREQFVVPDVLENGVYEVGSVEIDEIFHMNKV